VSRARIKAMMMQRPLLVFASCNSLQHTLQHAATHCNMLQRAATRCNALQRAATRCNALQRAATRVSCSYQGDDDAEALIGIRQL